MRRRLLSTVRARSASSEALTVEEIAWIYRALRKGREDGRDEAGVADFYYGEMEMPKRILARCPAGSSRRSTDDWKT
jgi:hypothetical protein